MKALPNYLSPMILDVIASFLKVGASFTGLILGMIIAYNVDTRYFTPTHDFTIVVKATPDSIKLQGTLVWARDCEFKYARLYATAEGQQSVMLAELTRAGVTKGAPTDVGMGTQGWGPFTIPTSVDVRNYTYLEILGLFRCHALWQQTQHLAKLPTKDLR